MPENKDRDSDPKVLKDCLLQSSLKQLVLRTQHIMSIKKVLQNCLPPELVSNCQILNVENGVLTLAANSAALVTRLRYMTPEFIEALNSVETGLLIEHIVCRVIPVTTPPKALNKKSPLVLSETTVCLLQETAKNVNHVQLKKSLQKLANFSS